MDLQNKPSLSASNVGKINPNNTFNDNNPNVPAPSPHLRRPAGKIEKLGLAVQILEWNTQGVSTLEIANRLNKTGIEINQSTISRWLKVQRETARPETAKIVADHVQKTVPADLDALEEMEAQCLARSREMKGDFSHRLAAIYIEEDLPLWCDMIRSAEAMMTSREIAVEVADCRVDGIKNEDDKKSPLKKAVESIMRQCLVYMANDQSLEKMRISARRTVAQIIDLKLKYSGILDGSQGGGIYFVDKDNEENLGQDERGRFFVVKGNQSGDGQ